MSRFIFLRGVSKFRVENPHLVAYILMHAEEIVPLMDGDKDSVNAMQRFLYAHFPAVVLKLLPEGQPDHVDEEIRRSDEYFNEVVFDDAVLSVVHPLMLLDSLYKQDVQRTDEVGNKKLYSELSGLHTMAWSVETAGLHASLHSACLSGISGTAASFSHLIFP